MHPLCESFSCPRSYSTLDTYDLVVIQRERGTRPGSKFTPVVILDHDLNPVEILSM